MSLTNGAAFMRIVYATIPFVLMTLRSGQINLKREYRGHQFIMPLLAVLYCLPAMFTVNKIAGAAVKAIRMSTRFLTLIPVAGAALSGFVNKIYSALSVGYGIQILCNTVIMTGYCVFKQCALPIINRWWKNWPTLYRCTTAHFYNEKNEKSVLKEQFSDMRKLFNILYYASVVYGAAVCILSLLFKGSAFYIPFYPVFSIIVLGEISFFLNGKTKVEIEQQDEEDDPDSDESKTDNSLLMEVLENTYKDRVLANDEIPESVVKENEHDWERELEEGDDLDHIAATYFASVEKGAESVNADYVYASRRLLHNESVLILNPFYRDLTEYLLLPVFHHLLTKGKCLVICGRMTNERDIEEWLRTGIERVTNLPKLWKISELSRKTIDSNMPDIGILSFRRLYDMETLYLNNDFFSRTTMVIMLEPSNLLGTGQIGLRSVVHYCEVKDKKITYVALDRNSDGLVDALSHVIRQSITEVIASPAPADRYWRMLWSADGPGVQGRILPKISHYLGIGTEIATLAMHEGVQSVHWYSGSKFPLADLKWNVEQYYHPITQYIDAPREQNALSERFLFHESLWQAEFTNDSFVIVEDEFCNLFEMSRTFAARIKKRGFINILSENYMLRDYMCENSDLFTRDPKAIPSIVPDYARTERNFVLRTLMRMAAGPVSEKELSDELSLHGYDGQQKTYRYFCELVTKHTGVENPRFNQQRVEKLVGDMVCTTYAFTAEEKFVESIFDSALKTAHYVIENEKTDTYPMGNRLMGHIEQTILPGQFFSYDGRYYQVREISPENGIIVRRASEHITGRKYYRQLRDYELTIRNSSSEVRDLRGISIRNYYIDYIVRTDGYLELKSRNYILDATKVVLDTMHPRTITYKDTLCVQFNDASPKIRFALCVLFNELFHTIYPTESDYLTAVIGDVPEEISNHPDYRMRIRSLVPYMSVNEAASDAVYFVEDSNIDLGLLVSIERNLQRFLEILTDYLGWYLDPARKKKPDDAEKESGKENDEDEESESDPGDKVMRAENDKGHEDDDIDGEEDEINREPGAGLDAPFKKIEYLTYEYGQVPDWLELEGTLQYLKKHRFDDSNLHRSRVRPSEFGDDSDYDPNLPGAHYCDFCGKLMKPGTYHVLKDGRERCEACSATAVRTRKQFREVYLETIAEMENIFGIKFKKKIKVRMANAKKVNEGTGTVFVPSPELDSRTIGYATDRQHLVLVENGTPKLTMKQTLAHELTHIWQFENWPEFKYDSVEEKSVAEGMAVWAETQYLVCIGETEAAKRYKISRSKDKVSPYGIGMVKYLNRYKIQESKTIRPEKTPFYAKYPPV